MYCPEFIKGRAVFNLIEKAELNVVRRSCLIQTLFKDVSVKFDVVGIKPGVLTTRGQIFLTIADRLVPFQVVRDEEFPFKGDAILNSQIISNKNVDILNESYTQRTGDITVPLNSSNITQIPAHCKKLNFTRDANFLTVPVDLSEIVKLANHVQNQTFQPNPIINLELTRNAERHASQPESGKAETIVNNMDLNHTDVFEKDRVVTLANHKTDLLHEIRGKLSFTNTAGNIVEITPPQRTNPNRLPESREKKIDQSMSLPRLDSGNTINNMSASLTANVPEKCKLLPKLKVATKPKDTSDESNTENAAFKRHLPVTKSQIKRQHKRKPQQTHHQNDRSWKSDIIQKFGMTKHRDQIVPRKLETPQFSNTQPCENQDILLIATPPQNLPQPKPLNELPKSEDKAPSDKRGPLKINERTHVVNLRNINEAEKLRTVSEKANEKTEPSDELENRAPRTKVKSTLADNLRIIKRPLLNKANPISDFTSSNIYSKSSTLAIVAATDPTNKSKFQKANFKEKNVVVTRVTNVEFPFDRGKNRSTALAA